MNVFKLCFLALILLCSISIGYSANFVVSNLDDDSPGSLRQALHDANAAAGADSIQFTVAGVIDVLTQLPALIDEVVIDGSSAPGYKSCDAPVIAINFVGTGGAHGLLVLSGGQGSTINALNIRGFTAAGISSESSSNVKIKSCFIGTDFTGNIAAPNNIGIILVGSPDCVIGGLACEGNVVSGNNSNGIALELGCHRTTLGANFVGLGFDKSTVLGNGLEGIYAYESDSLQIGLAGKDQGNYITGNAAQGIHLNGDGEGEGSDYAIIYNNYIGTNGTNDLGYGNQLNGIFLEGGSSDAIIGGLDSFQTNYSHRNGMNGLLINKDSDFNQIWANSFSCNAGAGISLDSSNGLIPMVQELYTSNNMAFGENGTPGNIIQVYGNPQDTVGADSSLCDCEGKQYIGMDTVDSLGNWVVIHNLGLSIVDRGRITATQTDPMGNTSEFHMPCGGIHLGSSIEEAPVDVSVYPNPATDIIYIEMKSPNVEIDRLIVLDPMGKTVFEQSYFQSRELKIDTENWSKGVYIIRLESKLGRTSKKVVLH